MKKLSCVLTVFAILFVSAHVSHANTIEGIWGFNNNYFVSIHISGSTVIGITYFPGQGESFVTGSVSGNTLEIDYSSDVYKFDATFIITSETTGTLTINDCVPYTGSYCLFPAGYSLPAEKMF